MHDRIQLETDLRRLLLAALLVLIPALLLAVIASGTRALPGDVTVARAIQDSEGPAADAIARIGYYAGLMSVATVGCLVLAALMLARDRIALALIFVAGAAAIYTNHVIKWIVARPRPVPGEIRVSEETHTYSFPSGHVMTGVIVLGLIFVLAPEMTQRRWLQSLVRSSTVAGLVFISFSRVYNGAHWPSDVLGGLLWGSVTLILLLAAYRQVQPASQKSPDEREAIQESGRDDHSLTHQ